MSDAGQAGSSARLWTLTVYSAQFFFGGWFLFHGLNHWFHFFPQPPGSASVSSQLISALIKSGLFDWVKAVEVVAGIALLANRFVPLAAIASFPISIVIGYLNIAVESDANALFVFFACPGAERDHRGRASRPDFAAVRGGQHRAEPGRPARRAEVQHKAYAEAATQDEGAFSASARAPLGLLAHLAGIFLGIALPVYLTLSTLPEPGEPGAAPVEQPAQP